MTVELRELDAEPDTLLAEAIVIAEMTGLADDLRGVAGLINSLRAENTAARNALQAARRAEPVAWRVRNDAGHWCYTDNVQASITWSDFEKLDVRPLYASQPLPDSGEPKP